MKSVRSSGTSQEPQMDDLPWTVGTEGMGVLEEPEKLEASSSNSVTYLGTHITVGRRAI